VASRNAAGPVLAPSAGLPVPLGGSSLFFIFCAASLPPRSGGFLEHPQRYIHPPQNPPASLSRKRYPGKWLSAPWIHKITQCLSLSWLRLQGALFSAWFAEGQDPLSGSFAMSRTGPGRGAGLQPGGHILQGLGQPCTFQTWFPLLGPNPCSQGALDHMVGAGTHALPEEAAPCPSPRLLTTKGPPQGQTRGGEVGLVTNEALHWTPRMTEVLEERLWLDD